MVPPQRRKDTLWCRWVTLLLKISITLALDFILSSLPQDNIEAGVRAFHAAGPVNAVNSFLFCFIAFGYFALLFRISSSLIWMYCWLAEHSALLIQTLKLSPKQQLAYLSLANLSIADLNHLLSMLDNLAADSDAVQTTVDVVTDAALHGPDASALPRPPATTVPESMIDRQESEGSPTSLTARVLDEVSPHVKEGLEIHRRLDLLHQEMADFRIKTSNYRTDHTIDTSKIRSESAK